MKASVRDFFVGLVSALVIGGAVYAYDYHTISLVRAELTGVKKVLEREYMDGPARQEVWAKYLALSEPKQDIVKGRVADITLSRDPGVYDFYDRAGDEMSILACDLFRLGWRPDRAYRFQRIHHGGGWIVVYANTTNAVDPADLVLRNYKVGSPA